MCKRGAEELSQSECNVRKTQTAMADFKDRKGPAAQKCRWFLEAGKGKETNSPL